MQRTFLGITGASGHAYAETLVRALVEAGVEVDVSITEAGAKVLRHELGVDAGVRGERLADALPSWLGREVAAHVRVFPSDRVEAPPSSGTALTGGVVLCPCSMGTLARVAAGYSSNLVERAADVALKEGRKLVIVPRETPLSQIHLENLLRLARLGAAVLPAMPGFYHRPKSVQDLVDHVVGKILDRLGFDHGRGARWQGARLDARPMGETAARLDARPMGETAARLDARPMGESAARFDAQPPGDPGTGAPPPDDPLADSDSHAAADRRGGPQVSAGGRDVERSS